jgi:hypothetical protein
MNLKTRAKQTHGPTAHQEIGPATLGRNSAPLERNSDAPAQLCLAHGTVTPLSEVPSRSRVGLPPSGTPPRSGARCPLSCEVPPRSRAERPLERVFVSLEGGHRPAASIPAPPVGAFNALTPQDCATTPTRLGITPRRCSTDSLGKTIPATVRHCAERPGSAPCRSEKKSFLSRPLQGMRTHLRGLQVTVTRMAGK